jgi:hypothetical protein
MSTHQIPCTAHQLLSASKYNSTCPAKACANTESQTISRGFVCHNSADISHSLLQVLCQCTTKLGQQDTHSAVAEAPVALPAANAKDTEGLICCLQQGVLHGQVPVLNTRLSRHTHCYALSTYGASNLCRHKCLGSYGAKGPNPLVSVV